jgi:nickel-dependent lactate racemase
MGLRVKMPYGSGTCALQIEADLLEPGLPALHGGDPVRHWNEKDRNASEREIVREALGAPIGSPRLREIVRPGESVAIIVNDITRLTRTDLMLEPLFEELAEAGVNDSDVFITFALGIHRPQTDDERRRIVGDAIYRRVRTYDHDCRNAAGLVHIGRTSFGNEVWINRRVWEADRIILTGEIIYHLIAGYSGGRKSLVPGVAGFETTTFNHRMIFHPGSRPGLLDGNPAHEDLLEACSLANPDFLLNVVLRPDGTLARAVAGHYDKAHRAGCQAVDEILRINAGEPYDLLVASAGGHPVDIDLRQAHKGLENACLALKPGGTIVFFAECPDGAGIRSFEDYINRYDDDRAMRAALEREFVVGGHKAYWIARLGRLYDVHLVSSLPETFVRRCHFTPVARNRAEDQVEQLIAAQPPGARVGVLQHSAFTLPVSANRAEVV